MYKLFVTIIAASALALAAPNGVTTSLHSTSKPASPTPTYSAFPQVARFENDPDAVPLVSAAPVNIYLDLLWNGFSLLVAGVAGTTNPVVPGVTPNSPPNAIAYAPADLVTIDQGNATMTTVYDDSTVAEFDLISFFFGCALGTEETAASAAQACNVTITGTKPDGTKVPSQIFAFNPPGTSAQMVEAQPWGYTGLQSVVFSTTSGDGALIATIVDTVTFTVYSQNPISP